MTNQPNTILDQNLVANMSQIGFGTIVKGWRGSKGLDYIIVGINTSRREIYAIKHNAINETGFVHAAVNKHKRVFKYTVTPSGRVAIVKGITSVLGQKRALDTQKINRFNTRVNPSVSIAPFNTLSLYTSPLADRRNTLIYE